MTITNNIAHCKTVTNPLSAREWSCFRIPSIEKPIFLQLLFLFRDCEFFYSDAYIKVIVIIEGTLSASSAIYEFVVSQYVSIFQKIRYLYFPGYLQRLV